jgi:DNA invertase Pin-like site-specific DNA recombinase
MVICWDKEDARDPQDAAPRPAAQYVRMSTEHQKYSTDNQVAAILTYASRRGFQIVQTYADEGKSGLRLDGRDALKTLLADVESGKASYEAILVYDVSRWGRFQDPDEAAAIELTCKRAGVRVHYCAEQFENDGSVGSSIIKTVKRAMAGEYSRELSVKVHAGQVHLIRLGYRQGGLAGFGLRRLLVDEAGNPKEALGRGEHKSIATDRVVLVPGPEAEIAVVREIYRRFADEGWSEVEIARDLNSRAVRSDLDREWTRGTVHQILINEKYIGNNVWGRTSFKLKQIRRALEPAEWVRADGAFEAIVDEPIFRRTQTIIAQRSHRLTDEEMLSALKQILERNGNLSGLIIDEAEGCPSSSCFRTRFGSLLRAYTLVGFEPSHDYSFIETNRRLRRLHPDVLAEVIQGIEAAGGYAIRDPQNDLLWVNDELTIDVVIARCRPTPAGSLRWTIRLDDAPRWDLTLAARMADGNQSVQDYYVLPRLDIQQAVLRLCHHNGLSLDAFRLEDLSGFFQLAARAPLRRAA